MDRKCDRCGKLVDRNTKRDRVGSLFVCKGCNSLSDHWKDHDSVGFAKNAHDVGNDPMVIRHCPMCGSGQVIARSDGSTECEFCQQVFSIKIEPFYPSWPQTVNGVPQDVPLSPNMDHDHQEAEGPSPEEGESAMLDPDDLSEEGEEREELFPRSGSFRTAMGDVIDEDAYIRHLAIQFASNRERVIDLIRSQRAQ